MSEMGEAFRWSEVNRNLRCKRRWWEDRGPTGSAYCVRRGSVIVLRSAVVEFATSSTSVVMQTK
jgi:hypothetical protein